MMAPQRRRRWTTLGLFLATALGGVLAYRASRRRARKRPPAPEEASVVELAARLRRQSAELERRLRRRRVKLCCSVLRRGRRTPPEPEGMAPTGGEAGAPAAGPAAGDGREGRPADIAAPASSSGDAGAMPQGGEE